MSRLTHLLIISIVCVCILPLPARAEKGYASDQVEVLVRTGPSHKHAIVKVLKSGAELEVLERDRKSGYARVRTAGGAEGWVLTRHLMAEPAARVLLEALSNQFSGDDNRPDNPRAQADLIRHEYETLMQRATMLEKNNNQLEAELSKIKQLAANAVQLDNQNQELRQQTDVLTAKLGKLEQENQTLGKQVEREWFYAGGLVLFAGLFLGLVIPRIQWRKRSRYSDFS
ncbi:MULTISPECIES: TIGR04211 family SH3 domain-containing protein [Nitrosomonas]|uniref:SH3 domain protein n=2 Tax=Nitrosomonas eutropha TaxID=916 RepID=A0ABX5MCX5_9PROT|nr:MULTISPECIES: TIGR04211 family SH3 domain-containing protein [Nitrosomonas]ABI59112.1 SH3, type 3 domain protein [Nitrosomonas eutropha C91]MXS81049.1 TIGR04211 family SH3 domain-containing protein [Nitrosomonas sp. GH22]PXV83919.1 SH3 domain protein [Nitrosomonas eutropha]SCX06799.1 SH3 domain protein [Nitrosomonas eutropha]SDW37553.1 SH3 domain protein [Nitrosomonas eutropha]